jgi:glutamate-1-semialdehyde 2,1-aminomutase
MGVILPRENFLKELREITYENNIILIFDEVITGFRVALGGAQELFNIKPDLTILGKIIGGGFPIGAFGGRNRIMDFLSPDGPVYQAGTLSGNPVAVEAGIQTIKVLMKDKIYEKLENIGEEISQGLKEIFNKASHNIVLNRIGSIFTLFFTNKKLVSNYNDVSNCNFDKFTKFFRGMLRQGIYMAPSQYEANFISLRHNRKDIEYTLKAAYNVLKKM